MSVRYCNVHSHRKARNPEEFNCRNAYHFLREKSFAELNYPVSVGMHPWHAGQFSPIVFSRLRSLALHPQVLAIGEIGLDKRNGPSMEVQLACWQPQFELAQELGLPLVVHCVRAWQEIIPFLRRSFVPVLLHDFRGNRHVLQSLLPLERLFFSFGKSLLQSQQSRDVFVRIDPKRILLETDQSSIPIAEIYQEAALLSGISATDYEQQMKKNCLAFFGEKALPFF